MGSLRDEIDGHDFGSGEFNILLVTDDVGKRSKSTRFRKGSPKVRNSLVAGAQGLQDRVTGHRGAEQSRRN
jgi:hypothetical protein